MAGALGGELAAELPFTLTHPKPAETPPPTETKKTIVAIHNKHEGTAENGEETLKDNSTNEPADVDLIQFDRFS